MSERDANQLAADVPAIEARARRVLEVEATVASSGLRPWAEDVLALVGLVGTLQHEHDECRSLGLVGWRDRAEAAEAALAEANRKAERRTHAADHFREQHLSAVCGIVTHSSWHEPVACAYRPEHEGDHSWASLPALPHDGFVALATTRQALTEITQVPYQSGRARGDVAVAIARRALAASAEAAEATGRGT